MTTLDAETYKRTSTKLVQVSALRILPVFDECIGLLQGKFTPSEPINKKEQMPLNITKNNMVFQETLSIPKQQQG